ncbi:MAG TPA: hypothetical protein EYP87_00890, partial [Flavobacteriaceae bacterium]|nr:hypothetical protein [Flavobacteriaceae bacterium]
MNIKTLSDLSFYQLWAGVSLFILIRFIVVAFGEGWGNALSAIATDDPIYFDTAGHNQSSGWFMDIENASHSNPGWFSEASIQRILYDLYDANDDGSDNLSLGF